MKSLVRPELPTAALRSSQATLAAVDNSAPLANRPESTYKSGKVVQTTGATSRQHRRLYVQRSAKGWVDPGGLQRGKVKVKGLHCWLVRRPGSHGCVVRRSSTLIPVDRERSSACDIAQANCRWLCTIGST